MLFTDSSGAINRFDLGVRVIRGDSGVKEGFNFSREHQALVAVFELLARMRAEIGLIEPRLLLQESSWHRKWIFSREQLQDLCDSFWLVRGEVEHQLLLRRNEAQRKPKKDIDRVLECVTWVIRQIENEVGSVKEVIYLRAKDGKSFKEIFNMLPGRFYPSMVEDYQRFLRKLNDQPEFEYLRRK